MNKTIRAIYKGGVFHPLQEVVLKDKSEVLVTVESTQATEKEAELFPARIARAQKLHSLNAVISPPVYSFDVLELPMPNPESRA